MNADLVIRSVNQTESSATVLVEGVAAGGGPPTGAVRGPYCQYARTLPADFPLQALPPTDGRPPAAATVVVDPCYWTPDLPFEYELRLEGEDSPLRLALRRWYAVGASFQLVGRRTVLRGAAVAPPNDDERLSRILTACRQTAAALAVTSPSESLLAQASQQGVAIVADLRPSPLDPLMARRLPWQGALLAAIVDADQLSEATAALRTAGVAVALAVSPWDPKPAPELLDRCDAAAVDMPSGARPPAWLAEFNRPAIAIRRSNDGADVVAARTAADALQAELAPEFDLAGYFVEASSQQFERE